MTTDTVANSRQNVVLVVADDPAGPYGVLAAAVAEAARAAGMETVNAVAPLRAAADTDGVIALLVLGSPLTPHDIDLLADWAEVPVFAVAEPGDRPALRSAVDAYLASEHTQSALVVAPVDEAVVSRVRGWVAARTSGAARAAEVVVRSEDGWDVHGTRWLPDRPEPVPGVVLLHSGRSDRAVFARLERLLTDAGLAVLNVDWRGRGQTVNRGTYFDLDAETKAAGWRDALAALGNLASCPEVDADRLGVVGVVHGAEYAARAAHRDRRVRALVLLTGYRPAEPEEAPHLTSGAVEVLYVTSTDHTVTTQAMRDLYDASPGRRTEFVEYTGGAIGYQLFEIDHGLEPRIARWLAEVLGR